jgi:hypothetical protein
MTEGGRRYVELRWSKLSEGARKGLSVIDVEELFMLEWKEKMNDVKKPTTYDGPKLSVPPDKSVIAEVREAMRTHPRDAAVAAKLMGIGIHNYRFIRQLILLEEKPFLSQEDRDKIKECFEIIERDRRVKPAMAIGNDVIGRNWAAKKAPYVIKTNRKRFDQTVITICEGCEATVGMTLPDEMLKEDVAKTIGELSRSMVLVGRLIQRLVGGTSEEVEDGKV